MSATTRRNFAFSAGLIGVMVAVFLVELVAPSVTSWGLVPRTQRGLAGIVTMPFLHGNLAHLLANLSSLVVLLGLMLAFHSERLPGVVILVMLLGGLLLWLFGRRADHIGASGLVYGLAGYMIVAGIVQRKFLPVIGTIAVALLYGTSLLAGLLPVHPGVSWDGHLAGGLAGALVALGLSSSGIRTRK